MYRIETHIVASEGIALGKAFVLDGTRAVVPEKRQCGAEEERERFDRAVAVTVGKLKELAGCNDIFAAHTEMADDPELHRIVREEIDAGKSAEKALEEACAAICDIFAQIDDELLRERVSDVRDVCNRIANELCGGGCDPLNSIPEGCVVVAPELLPSHTVSMDFSKVKGLVSGTGGATSHLAIIARGMGIPLVVGAGEAVRNIEPGDELILDGDTGTVIISPDPHVRGKYSALEKKVAVVCDDRPAATISGRAIPVYANAGSLHQIGRAIDVGADGIGLLRSELIYLDAQAPPSEDNQYDIYRRALELCGGRPLTVRTFDGGADKALPWLEPGREDNPMLGLRGIRISLAREDLFAEQLRALLRAAVHGPLRILLPMVVSVGEVIRTREILTRCMHELDARGEQYSAGVRLGVMIETPAAVLMADILARNVDFFSIGTNDLTQYIMSADRTNERVAGLYDPFDPAVWRAIEMTVGAAHRAGIEVGMCGSMAGDPAATELLTDIGLDAFSVDVQAVAAIKGKIRETP